MLGRGYEERDHLRTSPTRLAAALVVAVLTVLACNFAVGRWLERNGTNLGYVYISHKWRVLGSLDGPVDWLVLGDSSGSQSFDPRVLQAVTGERGVNLGTLGNFGLSDDLWMLEEHIERFGPPKRVVLVHVYDVWHRGLRASLIGRIPRDWVLSDESAELYDLDEDERREIFLNRYVPLYAERSSLRKSIEYAWLRAISDEEELAEIRRKDRSLPIEDPVLQDDGFVRMCGAVIDAVKRDARGHVKSLAKRRRFRISKDNREALLAIAALAREHGFTVHVVNGPVYERLRLKPDFQRYYAQGVKQLRRVVADYPEVQVVEDVRGYDGDQLQNVDHITCDAAEDYTRWVIDQVSEDPLGEDPLDEDPLDEPAAKDDHAKD